MSCCGIFNDFRVECEKKIKAVDLLNEINQIDKTTVKMIKLLDKQAIIESISFAGDYHFYNENGEHIEESILRCNNVAKYKIDYIDKVSFEKHFLLV